MKVSVLLLTHNEAANLPRCLASLEGIDDIIVVDSGSTDDTVAIAEAAGARVLKRPFDDFAGQRNFGLETGGIRHDWVLHLDADEVLTATFRATLAATEPPPGIVAWRVPSKTMLNDRWLRHAGMYPSYQVRLGHREGLRFVQIGHGQREALPPEAIATFPEPYLHHNFSHGLVPWFTKHARYAEQEAALAETESMTWNALVSRDRTARRRAFKRLAHGVPPTLRPLLRFLYVYVGRRGFLDGRIGAQYALMLAAYEAMIGAHVIERRWRRNMVKKHVE